VAPRRSPLRLKAFNGAGRGSSTKGDARSLTQMAETTAKKSPPRNTDAQRPMKARKSELLRWNVTTDIALRIP